MQWPIIRGIYSRGEAEWRQFYPVNMVPVPVPTGISEGYLRLAEGIVKQADGLGPSRGGIVWNGALYRVLGPTLVRVLASGELQVIGSVGDGGPVQMTYGFDYLALASAGKLWLYDGTRLRPVTDPDIGTVNGVIWIDGYFMTTDGEFLVVTELNDPFSVSPLKYGSSEADPDPIVAVLNLRNEVYALNRHTIEVFTNSGGAGFPFQRIEGAQIERGAVGSSACCVFADSIAFIGGGANEAPSVYIGANGQSRRVATREIDKIMSEYTEAELAQSRVSERIYEGHVHLIISLPRHTLVYDIAASETLQSAVWFQLSTDGGAWAADSVIRAYDRWTVSHPTSGDVGYLDGNVTTHWGAPINWLFSVPAIYNQSRKAVVHSVELVALTGRGEGTVATQYSLDGLDWSVPKWKDAGRRNSRLEWRQQGMIRKWRVQRFLGTANITPTRVEAVVEGLAF